MENSIGKFIAINDKYNQMAEFLCKRARIKSEASYTSGNEWHNRIVQNGKLVEIECWSDMIHITFNFQNSEATIAIEDVEIEMEYDVYKSHIELQYRSNLQKRLDEINNKAALIEKSERETLRRLKEKYEG